MVKLLFWNGGKTLDYFNITKIELFNVLFKFFQYACCKN